MDTVINVLQPVFPGVYMAKLDIKDAYYSVPIFSDDQKVLKFKFKNILYLHLALPNGYTKGSRKFTKLSTKLRQEGITLVAYLDDIFVMGWTYMTVVELRS